MVARLGGTARTDQLRRIVSERDLAAAVRSGSVVRLALGRYGLPSADAAIVAATRLDGMVFGLSAAQELGWPVLRRADRPWVQVPPNRNVAPHRRRGVRLGYGETEGRSVSSPLRTVLDCARRLPLTEALAVADSALRSGTVDPDELCSSANLARGPGSAQVAVVGREATPLAASPLESALRALGLGVPGLRLVPQVELQVEGVTLHPDLLDERLGLVVEAEGWLYHGGPKQFARDLWRYTALTVSGRTVVRFGYDDVTLRPDWVTQCLDSLRRTGERHRDCRQSA